MLNETTMQMLRQIAHGLSQQFGSNCEIVVHDLNPHTPDKSIVLIENGHVSNRKVGDGPSHIVLEALKHDPGTLEDKLAYLTQTHDGRILKSSTIYIRDEEQRVVAIFAINYDITALLAVDGAIPIQLVGKPTALMTKDDKIKAIQFLNNAGAFLITKSGDKISRAFNISKYTLYSYIDASKD